MSFYKRKLTFRRSFAYTNKHYSVKISSINQADSGRQKYKLMQDVLKLKNFEVTFNNEFLNYVHCKVQIPIISTWLIQGKIAVGRPLYRNFPWIQPEHFKTRAHFPAKSDERTGMQRATLDKCSYEAASSL